MADFKPTEMNILGGRRLHVVSYNENVGEFGDEVSAAVSVSNDLIPTMYDPKGWNHEQAMSVTQEKPMLMYNDLDNKTSEEYSVIYSKEDWDVIIDQANFDGDKPVFNGNLQPTVNNINGKTSHGFRVDPHSVTEDRRPFNQTDHIKATKLKRAYETSIENTNKDSANELPEDDGPEM